MQAWQTALLLHKEDAVSVDYAIVSSARNEADKSDSRDGRDGGFDKA